MNCSTCGYRKEIPLYSKCAGIAGRTRVGTAYYCGHPEITDPVPIIDIEDKILENCPFKDNSINIPENAYDTEVKGT